MFDIVPVFIYSLITYLYELALCSEHVKQYHKYQSRAIRFIMPLPA